MEHGKPLGAASRVVRATLSYEYVMAQRSVRLWPIKGATDSDVWGAVGEFIHGPQRIPEDDLCQEDIRRTPVPDVPENIKDEVIVVFKDKKKRDCVMIRSIALADCIDGDGKPTAGTRIEVPDELSDTFRLCNGPSTKRHIKFDDFAGSLYSNIKLTNDASWTRISPAMA